MPSVAHDSAMGMSLPTGNTKLGMWVAGQGRKRASYAQASYVTATG